MDEILERMRALADEARGALDELADPEPFRAELRAHGDARARMLREDNERLGHYGRP